MNTNFNLSQELDAVHLHRRIESAFASCPFMGVNAGVLLNDLVNIEFIHQRGDWRARERLKDVFRCARTHARALAPRTPQTLPDLAGLVLTTWMGEVRTADLLEPVIRQLGVGNCASVSTGRSILVSPAATQFSLSNVRVPAYRVWRKEFSACASTWRATIRELCRCEHLAAGAKCRMWLGLLHGTQRMLGWIELLRRNRPMAVLTEYDRNANSSCLILAARHLGIPTFTLTHGVVHEGAVGYAPIIADYIYNWGQADRERLIAAGVPPERCVLAGCPRAPVRITTNPSSARRDIGLPDGVSLVAMLGLSPWSHRTMKAMIDLFCSALRETPDASGFIRLHPSLKVADVEGLITDPGTVRIAPPSMSLEVCLAASDLVVSGGSGLIEDALTAARPVALLLEEHEGESSWAGQVVKRAGCPGVRSVSGLIRVLRLACEPTWRDTQVARAEQYMAWAYSQRGADAATATATHLLERSRHVDHHQSVGL